MLFFHVVNIPRIVFIPFPRYMFVQYTFFDSIVIDICSSRVMTLYLLKIDNVFYSNRDLSINKYDFFKSSFLKHLKYINVIKYIWLKNMIRSADASAIQSNLICQLIERFARSTSSTRFVIFIIIYSIHLSTQALFRALHFNVYFFSEDGMKSQLVYFVRVDFSEMNW